MIPLETSMSWIFWDKYGDPINQRDSSICLWINKLQINLKNFKQEWSKLTYRINNGSRLTTDKERHWFKHLNQIFTEVNDAINFSSNAAETSFPMKKKVKTIPLKTVMTRTNQTEPPINKKSSPCPALKSKVIRLNKQALCKIAQSKHRANVIKKVLKKINSVKIDFSNLREKKEKKIFYARWGWRKCLLLLWKINIIVHSRKLYILPMETKFPFTLSICTDSSQFLYLKINSTLRQSNILHQSVHIMVLTLFTAATVSLMNCKTVKTNKTVNLYLKNFFNNCTFGSG